LSLEGIISYDIKLEPVEPSAPAAKTISPSTKPAKRAKSDLTLATQPVAMSYADA
jgi:hypothetical protein